MQTCRDSSSRSPSSRSSFAGRAIPGAAALLACALAASCGGSDNSAPPPDGGAPDAGSPDAGPTAALNGCSTYEDHTSASDPRTIDFTNYQYTPPCMKILAGQTVTFSGTFSNHPLVPGVPSSATGTQSPNNPIPATSTGSTPLTVTFPTAGSYGYYCNYHFSRGMYGAIQVQ